MLCYAHQHLDYEQKHNDFVSLILGIDRGNTAKELAVIQKSLHNAAAELTLIGQTAPDYLTAQHEALSIIREVVPFEVGSFATVDPASVLWTSCVLSGMDQDPEREAFMFDNEYRQNDLHKIADLTRQRTPVARLSAIDPAVRARSPRYHMLQSYGAVDELRCAVMEQGNCWASFEIYRAEGSGTFTLSETQSISSLLPALARLVRLALLRQAASFPTAVEDTPGVIVLDLEGNVATKSPSSERWIEDLTPAKAGTPPVFRSLVMKLTSGGCDELSLSIPRASGGQLRLHAAILHAEHDLKVSIVIEPVKAPVLSATIVQAYGFTARESEVITWMARGMSTKEISERLGISSFTVNDHVKAVLQKAGVQSRQKLIATLFFDCCLPLRERDAIPGPYGWFLESDNVLRPGWSHRG
jgi:DNA-binding CsgD family transcriptional regulator